MAHQATEIFGESGVSLVELLVGLALLGIAAAMVAPRLMSSIDRVRAEGAAQELAMGIDQARAEALRSNMPQTYSPVAVGRGIAISVEDAVVLRPDGGSRGRLVVRSGGESRTIAIDPMTGLAVHAAR